MYYWTFQKKFVRQIIEKEGVYLPDFSYIFGHDYLEQDSYLMALSAFKENNPSFKMHRGLIFAFEHDINNPFKNIEEVRDFFASNPSDATLIKKVDAEDYKLEDYELLQLSGYSDLKTVPVDISFFKSLVDYEFSFGEKNIEVLKILTSHGKTIDQIDEMLDKWTNRVYLENDPSQSHLFQHHLPFIKRDNVVSVTPASQIIKVRN